MPVVTARAPGSAVTRPMAAPASATRLWPHTLLVSGVAAAMVLVAVGVGLQGWDYYATSLTERGYLPQHRLLRPSGLVGQSFGIAGLVLMLVPVAYALRKRAKRLREAGKMATWLEVHVFCGILGPVCVSLHTSFKFNGLVSVAYWSMVLVALSGVVGRYLYVRIPRSLRGQELTRAEIEARLQELAVRIADARLPAPRLETIERFERLAVPDDGASQSWWRLAAGDLAVRRALRRLRVDLRADAALSLEAVELIAERALLARRTAGIRKTKTLFDLWHVFHLPLVYAMFAIVILHVGVTVYLGYVPFRH